jgi:hypothetical protein
MQRQNLGQFIEQSHRQRHIRLAWVGGVLLAIANTTTILLNQDRLAVSLPVALVVPAIYLALAFGIYRQRFSAALAMILFFVAARYAGGLQNGLVWSLILGYIFVRAARELWVSRPDPSRA